MSGWGSSASSSRGAYSPFSDTESSNHFEDNGSIQAPLLSSPSDILDQIQRNISELVMVNAKLERQVNTIGSPQDRRDTRQHMFVPFSLFLKDLLLLLF